jgi:peptide/nickel transport system substrate-binding protein
MSSRPLRRWFAALSLALSVPAGAALAQSQSAVTIALPTTVQTLDPHNTATVGTDLSVLSHIYPALIRRGADLKLEPDLATSWEMLDDTTWRFKLNPAAKFENGEKLDAAAVKWNVERVLDPKLAARIRSWFTLVKEVKVVDDATVDIVTKTPFPALADQLSMFFLLPPKWASENSPAKAAMPGGAYRVVENVPDDHVTLEARPDYWVKKAAIQKVTFRIIPEVSSRIAALNTGEVDLITSIPVTEIERINTAGNARADSVRSTRTAFLKLNLSKKPMEAKALRQALNYGVDKEAISEAIFGGRAQIAPCQLLTSDYFGFNPDLKAYPYDPEKARALIKQSGIDTSQPIELEIPVSVYLNASEVVQAMASNYEELGLKVKITELDFGTFMTKHIKARDLAQMAFLTYAWATLDADGLLTLTSPGNVYDYWNDAEFGKLLDAARSTTDKAKRTALYKEATARMCEEAPMVFLYVQPVTYGTSKRIEWHARGDDWLRTSDMKIVN